MGWVCSTTMNNRSIMTITTPNRRTLLQIALATGAFAVAGCLGDDDGDGDDDDDDGHEENDTADETDDDTDDIGDVDYTDDADDTPIEDHEFSIETVADGLSHPWAIEPIPDESVILVTERSGELHWVALDDGTMTTIEGIPTVYAAGQGGLLDIALHPDYPDDPWVYLTYAAENDDGSATHLGRGRLAPGEAELTDFSVIHVVEPFIESQGHFGSRVIFGDDDMLYMTSGDRQIGDYDDDHPAQNTSNGIGATLRLEPDGSIPDDNPFVQDDDAAGAIYSYGHRNAQGMTVHPETGELWQSEHGEEDGDAIHVIEAGGNYGWPIAHYGCYYRTDDPVGEDPHERDDVVNPVYYWECETGGFPPAGMTFYDGEAFPGWKGDLFVGNLAGRYLGHFAVDDREVDELEPLLEDDGWRIRDVAVEPETGSLLVVTDESDAEIVRLVPA